MPSGWFPDYPAASNYLEAIGSCIGSHINQSGLCDPAIDAMITAAYAQQVTDPGAASDAWAAIDRAVVASAAVIPFSNNEQHEVVSRRAGNTCRASAVRDAGLPAVGPVADHAVAPLVA